MCIRDSLYAAPGEFEPVGEPALPGQYEGAVVRFRRIQLTKDPATLKGELKAAYERLVTMGPCTACGGARLNEAARTATVHDLTLPAAYAMQVSDLADTIRGWELGELTPLRDEITRQLDRVVGLGLGYLSLDRPTATLSGGEAQRIKMVRHLGSTLNDLLYVFDEPTTGLHARDVDRLTTMLTPLRDKGNTVIVVEHDPAVMAVADRIVEIGPGPVSYTHLDVYKRQEHRDAGTPDLRLRGPQQLEQLEGVACGDGGPRHTWPSWCTHRERTAYCTVQRTAKRTRPTPEDSEP